jgi:glycine cleavage system aminomethyltransferase T
VLFRGGRREAELLAPDAEGDGDSLFMEAETGVGTEGEDVELGVVTSGTLPRAMECSISVAIAAS